MKKLLVLMMALIMTLGLAACRGSEAAPVETSPTPAQVEKAEEFTEEQKALAQEFSDMVDAFNAIVDRINASPELLSDEELVTTMNDLSGEITAADDNFTSPETLTAEVMEGLKTAIKAAYEFIDIAGTALDEIDSAKADLEASSVIVPVEIHNFTGVDIYALALSPANNNEWGENLITEVIKNGEAVQGDLVFTADTLVWDILVQDQEENQLTFMGVDFSDASTDGAKLILESTEGGDYIAYVN